MELDASMSSFPNASSKLPDRVRLGIREALGGREAIPVVDDRDGEIHEARHGSQRDGDVARAENVKPGRGRDGLDEHLHVPAADHAQLLAASQAIVEPPGRALAQDLQRFPDDLLLDRAAADGAHDAAVRPDQHLRAGLARGRA